MASVFDVAKYILEKQGSMTTWKLQKLCYYSQAWSLAWTGEPLFDENFEAWENGPVCPELFRYHKGKFLISKEMLTNGQSEQLTEDQRNTVDVVLKDYGDMEPYALRELTHSENPWREARAGIPDGAKCDRMITKASMGEYYGSL